MINIKVNHSNGVRNILKKQYDCKRFSRCSKSVLSETNKNTMKSKVKFEDKSPEVKLEKPLIELAANRKEYKVQNLVIYHYNAENIIVLQNVDYHI